MEYKRVNVQAAEGCEISPYSSLENVVLGRGTVVRDGVQLKNVVTAARVRFSRNVSLYSPDENRPVRVGTQSWLSHGVLGEATGGAIEIGDYAVIAHFTLLLTSSGPGKQSPVLDALFPLRTGDIQIGSHCWLGARCVVLPGVRLGQGVVLGAHSVAAMEQFEEWSVYGGNPAKLRRHMDRERVQAAIRQWWDQLS